MDELKELKARAYDLIAILESSRKELDRINLEIAEKLKASEVKPE